MVMGLCQSSAVPDYVMLDREALGGAELRKPRWHHQGARKQTACKLAAEGERLRLLDSSNFVWCTGGLESFSRWVSPASGSEITGDSSFAR